ncbi:MAG: T9SS type A sorting domain-containing protein [Bacteroidetes bacterium]|nr:T9SS type A sorting domain-containing protein [Bacteroidota bacterium]
MTKSASSTSAKCNQNVRLFSNDALSATLIDLYPNPANSKVNITINDQVLERSMVSVIDLTGRIQEVSVTKNGSGLIIDCIPLTPGMYLIRVNSDKEYITRFIKE